MDPLEAHNESLRRAADSETPPDELDALARNIMFQAAVVRNPAASGATLERIGAAPYDQAVAEAVASHPNTPLPVVLKLAQRHPAAFLANPALLLHLLEQPDFPLGIQPDTLRYVVTSLAAPPGLLGVLSRHEQEDIAEAARMHVNLAGEAGADWAAQIDEAIWGIKIPHSSTQVPTLLALGAVPQWLIPPLLISDSVPLRQAAAASPGLAAELVAAVLRAGAAADLNTEAPPDPTLEPQWLERLARGGVWSCGLVATHPNTPPALLTRLAGHSSGRIRRLVATNPGTPPGVLPRLAGDKDRHVRLAVAKNPSAPAQVLARLAQDRADGVVAAAAAHPNLPPDVLERLAGHAAWEAREGVAKNPATPPHLLERLADDSERSVVFATARHPNLPQHVIVKLSQHAIIGVRTISEQRLQRVAPPISAAAPAAPGTSWTPPAAPAPHRPPTPPAPTNQDWAPLPADQIGAHARADDPLLRRMAAAQRDAPPELLAALAEDGHREVREAAAGNPGTPVPALEALAQGQIGGDHDHRLALVSNPSLPEATFARLIVGLAPDFALSHPLLTAELRRSLLERVLASCLTNNWMPPIAHAICLAHPQCPPEQLERWSATFAWLSRYAIIRNPAAPPAVLRRLADDPHALVRAAARAALERREKEHNEA